MPSVNWLRARGSSPRGKVEGKRPCRVGASACLAAGHGLYFGSVPGPVPEVAMGLLLAGLVVFIGGHLLATMRGARAALVARLGEWAYKGLFSLVALVG